MGAASPSARGSVSERTPFRLTYAAAAYEGALAIESGISPPDVPAPSKPKPRRPVRALHRLAIKIPTTGVAPPGRGPSGPSIGVARRVGPSASAKLGSRFCGGAVAGAKPNTADTSPKRVRQIAFAVETTHPGTPTATGGVMAAARLREP